MAVVMVLMVLGMTLAICYAMLRSQSTALLIQENEQLQILARQAALSGMRAALQQMHSPDWQGVDSSWQGTISAQQSFQVTYTAGDNLLLANQPAYQEYPYRVTVQCTGRAIDPDSVQRTVSYQIRAVVRLVPRNLSSTPADWPTMQNYTIFQTKDDDVELDLPCQLQGRFRVQGKLLLADHYPDDLWAWWTYLEDLNLMRSVGYADCRPVIGPVFLPVNRQELLHFWALASALRVPYFHLATSEVSTEWNNPTLPSSYQLYPGGPRYTIPRLPHQLENTTYQPDPQQNPLGIYYRDGSLEVGSGVSFQGCLFCRDNLSISQTDARFSPVVLPSVYQNILTPSGPIRLPSISCQNFYVRNTGGGQVVGLVATFHRFQIDKGPETVSFTLTGRLISRKINLRERQPWDTLDWKTLSNQYQSQKNSLPPGQRYFPIWLGQKGRDPTPRLMIRPDPENVLYHWPRWDQPIFQPHPNDVTPLRPNKPALRWELVRWIEQPTPAPRLQTIGTRPGTQTGKKK
ncbi:MAG: hypothetical protein NZ602_04140 [Thermoguttaceae bacterium]|nr:hypothetical protein [Thermoguttaceae bacterium]MDW8038332.1 hypothetical protein [Thermoguttaceae bacterium]